jgi:glycine/D-amino acid oxidase-like deaminating enzyme
MSTDSTDVAVIGGGYYGAFVATEIKTLHPRLDVVVVEKEAAPFTRASSTNQGQFHMGYMYSGDRALADACVQNIPRFQHMFGDAVDGEVESLYGIHKHSGIDVDAYAKFCADLGLPLDPVDPPRDVFGTDVTAAFRGAEKTFNSAVVQRILSRRIAATGIRLVTGFDVHTVHTARTGIRLSNGSRSLTAARVFNVTFADINGLHERSGLPPIPLRHDTFLHFVVDLPDRYRNQAATVIRGPYASLLPSSYRKAHVLASAAHRRQPDPLVDARAVYDRAVAETAGYLPVLEQARYVGHTLGTRAAHLDPSTGGYSSTAAVFADAGMANYHVVLGGKVSCVFEVAGPVRAIMAGLG